MNQRLGLVAMVLVAGALITCGWLVRDGLLAVSAQIRDKQVSPMPAEIHLGVNNPEMKVTFGSIRMDHLPNGEGGSITSSGTLNIESLKIEIPASQPTAGGK